MFQIPPTPCWKIEEVYHVVAALRCMKKEMSNYPTTERNRWKDNTLNRQVAEYILAMMDP